MSTSAQMAAEITVYPPERQGTGGFDGGRITEIKPIGFPGDGAEVKRLGPLFYWAWASARGDGIIGLHPHQAFEILSYVLEGEVGHYDTLGTRSRVGAGGAQLMQTGSGVQHEERMFGATTEFFQIWFEPHLREALHREPTYREFRNDDFPVEDVDGAHVKRIIGGDAPVHIVADIRMVDVRVDPNQSYRVALDGGRYLGAMTVSGGGVWIHSQSGEESTVQPRDFVVVNARAAATVEVRAGDQGLRFVAVEAPMEVDYPLYPKA